MVTGRVYKNYIESLSSFSDVTIVGSQKSKREKSKTTTHEKDTLLFVPEGTKQATFEFLDLIQELVQNDLPNKIVLRLHPNLPSSFKVRKNLQKLKNFPNFHVSQSDLSSDLEKSVFVFFRSSAVGVEALLSGAHLVFYAKSNEPNINPLSLVNNLDLHASSASDVLYLLTSKQGEINAQERSQA